MPKSEGNPLSNFRSFWSVLGKRCLLLLRGPMHADQVASDCMQLSLQSHAFKKVLRNWEKEKDIVTLCACQGGCELLSLFADPETI